MRKIFKKLCLIMVLLILSVSILPNYTSAAAKYSKEEKEIATILANLKDSMKNPDSFKIKKMYKADYIPDDGLKLIEDGNIMDSYDYKIIYMAENSYGGVVTTTVYASKGHIYEPEEDYYSEGIQVSNESKYSKTKITKIMKLANKYYDEL